MQEANMMVSPDPKNWAGVSRCPPSVHIKNASSSKPANTSFYMRAAAVIVLCALFAVAHATNADGKKFLEEKSKEPGTN